MKRQYLRGLISGIIIIIVGILLYRSFVLSREVSFETKSLINNDSHRSNSGNEMIFPVEVDVARVGGLIKSLKANGTLRAKREVGIILRVGGEITLVSVHNGSYVHVGQLLAKLNDVEYELTYQKTKNALLSAEIDYRMFNSGSPMNTIDSSMKKNIILENQEKLDKLENDFINKRIEHEEYYRLKRDFNSQIAYGGVHRGDIMANRSGLNQAQEANERAKLDYESTTIKAPFDGYIADSEISEGMRVQSGKELFKLIDVSCLLVDVGVLESEIKNIHLGVNAKISVNAFPEKILMGTVTAINPMVDDISKTVKVTIEIKDRKQMPTKQLEIRPGMICNVTLEVDNLSNRLIIPKNAVLSREQRNLVFIVKNGFAKWQYVDIGAENEEFVEIKSGSITKGDTVIVNGHYTLGHDVPVKIVK
jgi:membrane fusion protein, multidrug efflux system